MKAKGIDKHEAKELSQATQAKFMPLFLWHCTKCRMKLHDVEETVLTITRVKRSYSPWSSKIYTLRETPPRKVKSPYKK